MALIENSSYLKDIKFDRDTNTLIVEFVRGKHNKYKYSPVTFEAYQLMMNAKSIGSYFSKNIRDNPNIGAQVID